MKLLRKSLILGHRYFGIGLGLLVIMWFVTGIVMMYAGGMPRLTAQMRLDRLPNLNLQQVRLTPAEAMARAQEADGGGSRLQLLTVLERPAYRVGGTTVFADTGDVMDPVSREQARTIASRFMQVDEDRVSHVRTLTGIDQWTLGQSRAMPLEKFRVNDVDGTELYVQPRTGEVVTLTTDRSRMLAWMGVIPHWLYFTALRENQPLWFRIVVWTSGAACVLALMGLVLAIVQFRRSRPFNLAKAIPYSGWMRWHYLTGAVFGVFTLTWAFSGLLSMEPFAWTNATGLEVPRDTFTGGAMDPSRFGALKVAQFSGRALKEIEFVRIQDEHYYVLRLTPEDPYATQRRERLHQPYYITGRVERDREMVNARTMELRSEPFAPETLLARLRTALPDVPILESELLTDYDSYYYSRGRQTPLPVLRVKFDDPAETWVYIDPEMSQVLASIHRLNRVERWFYNGLHSLDFAFWYDRRPLWDIGMLTLLVGGLTTTCLGLLMGIKRMRRRAARVVTPYPEAPLPDNSLPDLTVAPGTGQPVRRIATRL
jgi:hypothetical protein